MGYSVVRVEDVERAGPTRVPVAGAEGMTIIAIGACPVSYEPRGPF